MLRKRELFSQVLNLSCRHACHGAQGNKVEAFTKSKERDTTMGMAASQARFLGLTARMNNVEYEGQQINQQRTALSNKTASYYTDLLGMEVPTAPSVEQFTQTVYTFDDGALTNQVTSLIASTDGSYKISYIRSWTDDFAAVSATPSIITEITAGTVAANGSVATTGVYKIGSEALRTLDDWTGVTFQGAGGESLTLKDGKYMNGETEYTGAVTATVDTTIENNPFNTDFYKSLSGDQFKGLSAEETAFKTVLNDTKSQDPAADWFVRYKQNTSTGEYEAVFYNTANVVGAIYSDETNNSQSFIEALKIGSAERVEEIKGVDGCYLEQDSTGRYINITIDGKTYALTTNTVTDQEAYDDAMNQYEYDKALYDQSIAEINAKIEIIQAEDKNLELRLKQLDTEHNAISNEKDAVSKVIEKSVESGFKTFG